MENKRDITNALLIIGLIFIMGGLILITQTLIATIPISIGGIMFGYGVGNIFRYK